MDPIEVHWRVARGGSGTDRMSTGGGGALCVREKKDEGSGGDFPGPWPAKNRDR